MQTKHPTKWMLPALVILSLLLGACSGQAQPPDDNHGKDPGTTQDASPGTRHNTPHVLTPEASGTDTRQCSSAVMDLSNISQGYLMVDYTGTNSKVKLQITGPDSITYTYNLHGGYEVFPLTAGSGSYTVVLYENISGDQYATAMSEQINASITNEFGPYLYPNQYINFTAESTAVSLAQQLAVTADTDLDVVSNVYNYIIEHFTYDYDKAEHVESGYLPDINTVLADKTGICFDYTAVMTAMLRSQNIPTRLEVGYMDELYHAWISVYIKDMGWINGIIEFDGKSWELMDPTFASTSQSPQSFTSENTKYTTKYVY